MMMMDGWGARTGWEVLAMYMYLTHAAHVYAGVRVLVLPLPGEGQLQPLGRKKAGWTFGGKFSDLVFFRRRKGM